MNAKAVKQKLSSNSSCYHHFNISVLLVQCEWGAPSLKMMPAERNVLQFASRVSYSSLVQCLWPFEMTSLTYHYS